MPLLPKVKDDKRHYLTDCPNIHEYLRTLAGGSESFLSYLKRFQCSFMCIYNCMYNGNSCNSFMILSYHGLIKLKYMMAVSDFHRKDIMVGGITAIYYWLPHIYYWWPHIYY